MLELGSINSQMNKTVGIHENFQAVSVARRAQESIGKNLLGQTFPHVNVDLKLTLFSEVEHKWKTSWFDYAMEQLSELDRENVAEGYPPVSDNKKNTAKQILIKLNSLGIESSLIVYSTMESEVAIRLKSNDFSLLILIINENEIETYYSFFNGDTEISSDTAPFENFYYFLMTQLVRLGKSCFMQFSRMWVVSPEKEKRRLIFRPDAKNQSLLEFGKKNLDLLQEKSLVMANATQHRIHLVALGSSQIVANKQYVNLDMQDNRLIRLSSLEQMPQPALLAKSENLRNQSLRDFANGPQKISTNLGPVVSLI